MGSEFEALRERLAEIEHQRWADWQLHVHSVGVRDEEGWVLLPSDRVAAWERQIVTPYTELTEEEKARDLAEVDRYWPLLMQVLTSGRTPMTEADRRLNVEGALLNVLSSFGGQKIIAGEAMTDLVRQLADEAEELARGGFLPPVERHGLRRRADRGTEAGGV